MAKAKNTLSATLSMHDGFSAPLLKAAANSKAAVQQIVGADAKLIAQNEKVAKAMKARLSPSKQLDLSMRKEAAAGNKLQSRLVTLDNVYERTVVKMRAMVRAGAPIPKVLIQQANAAKKTADALRNQSTATTKVVAKSGQYNAAIKSMIASSVGFAATGPLMALGIVTAMGAIVKSSVSAAAGFEKSMVHIKAVGELTGKEITQVKNRTLELSRASEFTAQQVSGGFKFMAMAGVELSDMLEGMPQVLALATAGSMELGRSADIVTNVMKGFKLGADELNGAVDVIAKATTSANIDVSQLGQSFKFVGPVARAAGISFEETTAAISQMADAGIQGTMAGRGLRMGLSKLIKPTKDAKRALNEMGVTVHDSKGRLLSLTDIITQLEPHAADSARIMRVFGTEAGTAMQTLISTGGPALEEFTRLLEKSGGTAEKIAKEKMATLSFKTDVLISKISELKIGFGEDLTPAMKDAADGAGIMVSWFTKYRNTILEVLGVLNPTTTMLYGIKRIAGQLGIAFGETGDDTAELVSDMELVPVVADEITKKVKRIGVAFDVSKEKAQSAKEVWGDMSGISSAFQSMLDAEQSARERNLEFFAQAEETKKQIRLATANNEIKLTNDVEVANDDANAKQREQMMATRQFAESSATVIGNALGQAFLKVGSDSKAAGKLMIGAIIDVAEKAVMAYAASAAAGAASSQAPIPFVGPALAVTASTAMFALIRGLLAKFDTGGIATSASGSEHVPILIQSKKERVLNAKDTEGFHEIVEATKSGANVGQQGNVINLTLSPNFTVPPTEEQLKNFYIQSAPIITELVNDGLMEMAS